MTAKIFLKNIAVRVKIGVTDEERSVAQFLYLDLEINFLQTPKASITDNIADTICYDTLCNQLIIFLEKSEYKLIEKLAADSLQHLTAQYENCKFTITVRKKPKVKGLEDGYVEYFTASY